MKTTSFEISKKLAEIGFKAPENFFWIQEGISFGKDFVPKRIEDKNWVENCGVDFDELCPAYDLETILEALPNKINDKENCNEYRLTLSHNHICYRTKNEIWEKSIVYRNLEESLADMAARLLIELHSQGLVKFNQETDE